MIFKSLARDNEIGANSYLIDTGDIRIILDAGMHPKNEGEEAVPHYEELPHDSIDVIIISHSHLDHVGTLPVLMQQQPNAVVYMTAATAALADALLHNSVNVMKSKRTELGISNYPLFHHDELDELQERWLEIHYNTRLDLTDDTSITFYDAGHILGSAGVMIESKGHRLFYTGDVNFENSTLITGAKFPKKDINTLVIESTRGAVPRKEGYAREAEEQRLLEAILKAFEKGGSALIPVFAMGKTQEVLTMIHKFKESGKLPEKTPVFIGGLSTKMTVIFDAFADHSPRTLPGFQIFEDMDIAVSPKRRRKRKAKPITYQPGAIYALSSGMMTEKTTSNNFARGFISNPKNSLLFVGYCAPETPGHAIRHAARGDSIALDPEQPPVLFDCDLEIFDFSGHAPRADLLDYMLEVSPDTLYLVHGDRPASEWFIEQLDDKLSETEIKLPTPCKEYKLA